MLSPPFPLGRAQVAHIPQKVRCGPPHFWADSHMGTSFSLPPRTLFHVAQKYTPWCWVTELRPRFL